MTVNRFANLADADAMIDYDDLISEGNIALLRAIRQHDPTRGKFSTFAFKVIVSQLIGICYKQRKALQFVSLDAPLTDDKTATLADVVGEDDREYDTVDAKQLWEQISANMNTREREVYRLYYGHGFTLKQIAKRVNTSGQTVFHDLQKAEKILRERADIIKNGIPSIRKGARLHDGIPVEVYLARNSI